MSRPLLTLLALLFTAGASGSAEAPLEVQAELRPPNQAEPVRLSASGPAALTKLVCAALEASGDATCSGGDHQLILSDDGGAYGCLLRMGGQTILATRQHESERQSAHAIADAVLEALGKPRGCFRSSLICYTRKERGGRSIHCGDWAGGDLRQVVAADSINLTPDISPDRRMLAYVSYRSGNPDLWLRDLRGAGERRIGSSGALEATPVFTPDGRAIIFASSREGSTNLYRAPLDGGEVTRVTSGGQIDISPTHGTNGELYFVSDRAGSPQVYRNPARPSRMSMTGKYNVGPAVHGDKVAYASQGGGFRLHLQDGSGDRILNGRASCESPRFSPDGRFLAASCDGRITIIRVSDGSVAKVNGEGSSPTWR